MKSNTHRPIVWVTREEPTEGALSSALTRCGCQVIVEPVISRSVVGSPPRDVLAMRDGDWLVLTSAFSVDIVPDDVLKDARIAVVGPATRKRAEARGHTCELEGPGPGARALLQLLQDTHPNARVCYPRSSEAQVPTDHGFAEFRAPVVYQTISRTWNVERVAKANVIAVTSPSAVNAILSSLRPSDARPLASIGPTTSRKVRELGRVPWVEASSPTFDALAQAISERYQRA